MSENPASSSLQQPPSSSTAAAENATVPQNPQSALSSPQIIPPLSPSVSSGGGADHIPHISSPQLQPQHSQSISIQSQQQQQQLQQLQQQQIQSQQQQNLMAAASSAGLQIQPNMQRSGSMQRLTQLQQQFGATAAASLMRQQILGAGQMNFGGGGGGGGGAQLQQQQQMASRSGMMAQAGQLPGQTAQHFNIQSQMLGQPRQKSLAQGGQFHSGNTSGQVLQGMQTMGMMGSLGLNPQSKANGPMLYGQQRFAQGQMRQQPQQMLSREALSSPQQKLPAQSLPRTSSVAALNSHMSNLSQNGQSASLSQQQQWLKHLQPSNSGSVPPSYHIQQQQRQQQAFLQQQLPSSQLHQKSMGLTQQQLANLLQQQQQQQPPQLNAQQQQQNLIQQQQQLQQIQQMQQLQSPRVPGASVQKSISLTGSQPETPGTTMTGGSSSQGTEATNQLLGKRKIRDLVAQLDPLGEIDPEVEDLLLEIADDFIDTVTTFACSLAKHRKSSTLEAKDVLLHLEKNWRLTIPGFTKEEQSLHGNTLPVDAHNKRLKIIQELVDSQMSDRDTGGAKNTNMQIINDLASGPIKPSTGSDQICLPAVGSQMLQKVRRF